MNIPPLAASLDLDDLTPGDIDHLVNTWNQAAQAHQQQTGQYELSEEHLITAAIYFIHGIHQTDTIAAYEELLEGTGPAAPAAHYLLTLPEHIFNTRAIMETPWLLPLKAHMTELYLTVRAVRKAHEEKNR